MNVSRELIRYYFDYAVSDYLDENEDVPSEMIELEEYMPNLQATIMNNHEQLFFALGLKKLLDDECVDVQGFYGYRFPLEDDEIRCIMKYLLGVVSPQEPLDDELIVITEEPIESSRIENGLLHKVDSGQTLETIAVKYGLSLDFIKKANPYWYEHLGYSDSIDVGKTVRLKLADDWH